MERKEPAYTVGGSINWCSYYGKQDGGSLKKTKNTFTIWSSNLFLVGHLEHQLSWSSTGPLFPGDRLALLRLLKYTSSWESMLAMQTAYGRAVSAPRCSLCSASPGITGLPVKPYSAPAFLQGILAVASHSLGFLAGLASLSWGRRGSISVIDTWHSRVPSTSVSSSELNQTS